MSEKTSFNVTAIHITQSEDVCGGKPVIAGRRIRVQDVYVWHDVLGMSADEIASEYDLSLAQVYAALTYVFEHLDDIRSDMQESEVILNTLKQKFRSKLPLSGSIH